MVLITVLLNLNSLENFTCQPGKLKMQFTSSIRKSSTPGLLPGHYAVYSLYTLFIIIWLELEPLNASVNNTFTRKYETNLPDEIIKIPVQVSFLHKQYRNDYSCRWWGDLWLILLNMGYYTIYDISCILEIEN